jgi:hypothetical protein
MSPTRYTPVRLTRAGRVTMPPQICSPVHLIHQLDEGRVLMSSTRCSPVHLNRAGWVMMSPTRWRSVLVHFNPQIDRFRMAPRDVSNRKETRSFESARWSRVHLNNQLGTGRVTMSPTRRITVHLNHQLATLRRQLRMSPTRCNPVHLNHQLGLYRLTMSPTRCSPVHLKHQLFRVALSPTRLGAVPLV